MKISKAINAIDALYDDGELIEVCELFLATYRAARRKDQQELLQLSYTRWFCADLAMCLVDNL